MFLEVADEMLQHIPSEEEGLIADLRKARETSLFQPPESQSLAWQKAQLALNYRFEDSPPSLPWQEKLVEIWLRETSPVTQADLSQCQAERPNSTWSPFALGPANEDPITGEKRGGSRQQDRMWRCRQKPALIIEEPEPGLDGVRGEMSLCAGCFELLCAQGVPYRIKSKI